MYFVLFGESVEGKEQPTVTTFFSTGWPLPFSPLFFFSLGPSFLCCSYLPRSQWMTWTVLEPVAI